MIPEFKKINDKSYDRFFKASADVIRATNHKLRRSIIELLAKNGKLTVTRIYVTLRLEQSVCSQHLGILRKQGIVLTKRNGKEIEYSVNEERLTFLLESWEKSLPKK